jgi:hypothetical protein
VTWGQLVSSRNRAAQQGSVGWVGAGLASCPQSRRGAVVPRAVYGMSARRIVRVSSRFSAVGGAETRSTRHAAVSASANGPTDFLTRCRRTRRRPSSRCCMSSKPQPRRSHETACTTGANSSLVTPNGSSTCDWRVRRRSGWGPAVFLVSTSQLSAGPCSQGQRELGHNFSRLRVA